MKDTAHICTYYYLDLNQEKEQHNNNKFLLFFSWIRASTIVFDVKKLVHSADYCSLSLSLEATICAHWILNFFLFSNVNNGRRRKISFSSKQYLTCIRGRLCYQKMRQR